MEMVFGKLHLGDAFRLLSKSNFVSKVVHSVMEDLDWLCFVIPTKYQ